MQAAPRLCELSFASLATWPTTEQAGEWGQVVLSCANYRGPALSGDITVMDATVIDKLLDADGRNLVQVDCKMINQLGVTMATAKAEVEPPAR